jgi:hypothetical protein
MQKFAALVLGLQCLALSLLALSAPAAAQAPSASRTISWVEEWDPAAGRWVRVEEHDAVSAARAERVPVVAFPASAPPSAFGARYAVPVASPSVPQAIAQYGPFVVIDARRAALVGSTDSASPRAFDAMLRDFPELARLEMVEAPGTSNDIANLALGRRIRAAGIETHVPRGGSVRSGAVELFLAGTRRTIADGAQFAVHAWLDNYGREPGDFAADDPANRLYLDYYAEMGMSEARARDFYAMTNSVPHRSARWLSPEEMRGWIAPEAARPMTVIVPVPVTAAPLALAAVPLDISALLPVHAPAPTIDYADLDTIALPVLASASHPASNRPSIS